MTKKFSILGIAPLLLLSGCNKGLNIEYVENLQFQYGDKVNSCEFIKSINGKEVGKDMINGNEIAYKKDTISCSEIDTSKIGKGEAYFSYKKQLYSTTYEVIDNESPFIFADDDIYISEGEEFNLEDYITVEDEDKIISSITGNIDSNSSGIYKILYTVSDSSGNTTQKEINIHVGDNDAIYSYKNESDDASERAKEVADELKKQLQVLEKDAEIIRKNEENTITDEEFEEINNDNKKNNTLTPNCKEGTYEMEGGNVYEVMNKAYSEYDCLTLKITPIKNEDGTISYKTTKIFGITAYADDENENSDNTPLDNEETDSDKKDDNQSLDEIQDEPDKDSEKDIESDEELKPKFTVVCTCPVGLKSE